MKADTATFGFEIWLYCPHCEELVNLADIDSQDGLCELVFGTRNKPPKWEDIGFDFDCPECGKETTLDKMEY